MGAAGNKKPKKSKAGKHTPKYETEDTMTSGIAKGQKKNFTNH
jgi:hypothetical protein